MKVGLNRSYDSDRSSEKEVRALTLALYAGLAVRGRHHISRFANSSRAYSDKLFLRELGSSRRETGRTMHCFSRAKQMWRRDPHPRYVCLISTFWLPPEGFMIYKCFLCCKILL